MSKLISTLKFFVLVSLLILFLSSSFTNKNHCGTCEFELEGEEIDASQFMNEYFEVCINPYVERGAYNYDFMNETFNFTE